MTTTTRIWLAGGLIGLAVLVGAEAGWAACCKCSSCVEGGAACFTTLATQTECMNICPVAKTGLCNFDSFSADATCGQGEFADCAYINGQLVRTGAPAMSLSALGVTAIGLLVAGVGFTLRGARRAG
jgi:hypothetical protein